MFKYIFLLIPSLVLAQDSWIGKDKQEHFAGSVLVGLTIKEKTNPDIAFITTVGIGIAKEVYDYKHPTKHTASYKDLVWDIAGAYIGAYSKQCRLVVEKDTLIIKYTWVY